MLGWLVCGVIGSAMAAPSVVLERWGRDVAAPVTPAPVIDGPCARADHGDVVAWSCPVPTGVEHTWHLRARPHGDGPVVLSLAVAGAEVEAAPHGVALRAGRERWAYGGLVARDATARVLPAALVARGDHVEIHVDDTGAAWPITVDPVLQSPAYDSVGGDAQYEYMGWVANPVGDLDGNGYPDLLTVSLQGAGNNGRAALWYGDATGYPTAPSRTWSGTVFRELPGAAASFGDLDDDGYDDLVMGHSATGASAASNTVRVYYGSNLGITETPVSLTVADGDGHGVAVFARRDLSGDDIPDVVTGEPGADNGNVRVWFGGSGGVSTTPDLVLSGTAAGQQFGRSITAGDLDGDGYAELIVGAPAAGTGGEVYLYAGTSTGLSSTRVTLLTTTQASARLGWSVVSNLDIDGDGLDDLVVGEPDWDLTATANVGRFHVLLGTDAGGYATVADTYEGTVADGRLGADLRAAGDPSGDGYDDVVAQGDPGGSQPHLLWEGSPTGLRAAPTHALTPQECTTLTGIGDLDRDGFDDLGSSAINAEYNGIPNAGSVFVLRGASFDADVDGYENAFGTGEDCDDADADVNPAATEVCDDLDVDEDCSGEADDADSGVDASTRATWYADADHDGFGDVAATTLACDLPAQNVADATDCDDTDFDVNPDATEVCDDLDVDEDCSGEADDADDAVDTGTLAAWFLDADEDGFGAGSAVNACDAPTGHVADDSDCDDANEEAFPGAPEVRGDGVDQDCDGDDLPALPDDDDDDGDGCGGCASTGTGSGWPALAFLLALGRRRARSPADRSALAR